MTMLHFAEQVRQRNEPLFWFGLVCLLLAGAFLVLTRLNDQQVLGANAWYKPFKFAFSTFLFAWAMAWYVFYLQKPTTVVIFNWVIIVTLGLEIAYIAWQAGRGQMSHFNVSTPFYSTMFSLMAAAATVATLATAYIGLLFCQRDFPELPDYYLWSIRLGIGLFVVFAFEGFAMGARLSHTVGGPDGSAGLPIVNWSFTLGDLRIAHFVGMHALQVLPLLAFYVFKDLKITLLGGLLYTGLAIWILSVALQGKPLLKL
jgi:hypothetical protein